MARYSEAAEIAALPLHVPREAKAAEGWLEKRNRFLPMWNRRFFVAGKGHLYYYHDKVEPQAETGDPEGLKGDLPLYGGRVEKGDERNFRVVTAARTLELRIEGEDAEGVVDHWIARLQEEIGAANLDLVASGKHWPGITEWVNEAREAHERAIVRLSVPAPMQKFFTRLGSTQSHAKLVSVENAQHEITWRDPDGSGAKSLPIHLITEILVDPQLPEIFSLEAGSQEAGCCLSLVATGRDLHLQAETPEARDDWVSGMQDILAWFKIHDARELANQPRGADTKTRLRDVLRRHSNSARTNNG